MIGMNGLKRVPKCFSSNLFHLLIGVVIGFTLCSQFRTFRYQSKDTSFCPFESLNGQQIEDKNSILEQLIHSIGQQNEDKNLVLIGVMTANKYLDSRALSIYNTWAQNISGKIIFFSSSSSKYSLFYIILDKQLFYFIFFSMKSILKKKFFFQKFFSKNFKEF